MGEPGNKSEQGRWVKGQSGNPNGRPKGYAEFKEKCREHTPAALEALKLALADPDSSVSAARVLLEFGWGKPTQAVEVSGPGGDPFQLVIHSGPK